MSYIIKYTTNSGKLITLSHKLFESAEDAADYGQKAIENGAYKKFNVSLLKEDTIYESINALKQIVADKDAAKVHGIMVDMFTASAIMQVYDAVNDVNKGKIMAMLDTKQGLLKMSDFAMSKVNEGKSPHKKGSAKYKAHMAAKHASMGESISESEKRSTMDRKKNI